MTQVRSSRSALFPLAVALSLLALGGCGSPSRSERNRDLAAMPERPVAMKGESDFFDGQLGATVTVSRGFSRSGMSRREEQQHGPYGEAPSMTDVFSTELNDPANKDYAETAEKTRALQLRG